MAAAVNAAGGNKRRKVDCPSLSAPSRPTEFLGYVCAVNHVLFPFFYPFKESAHLGYSLLEKVFSCLFFLMRFV